MTKATFPKLAFLKKMAKIQLSDIYLVSYSINKVRSNMDQNPDKVKGHCSLGSRRLEGCDVKLTVSKCIRFFFGTAPCRKPGINGSTSQGACFGSLPYYTPEQNDKRQRC